MTAIWKKLFDIDFRSGNLSYLDFTHVSYWIFLFAKMESKHFFPHSSMNAEICLQFFWILLTHWFKTDFDMRQIHLQFFDMCAHMIKVAFCQKVWCSSNKYAKRLSWAENLNFLPITQNNLPYECHHNPLLIINRFWILIEHKVRVLWKKLFK